MIMHIIVNMLLDLHILCSYSGNEVVFYGEIESVGIFYFSP